MSWRVARSLNTLLAQINASAPRRSKAADGSIGDAAHSSRLSDHNPDSRGVVRARDFTHDPRGGFDAHAFAERLRGARDSRVKYVISRGRIFSGHAGPQSWTWRPYRGANPHNQHVHVSVNTTPAADLSLQWSGVTPSRTVTSPSRVPPTRPAAPARPTPPAAPVPTPAPRKDWFDMATEAELRKIIREENTRSRNDDHSYLDRVLGSLRTTLRTDLSGIVDLVGLQGRRHTDAVGNSIAGRAAANTLLVAELVEKTARAQGVADPKKLAAAVAGQLTVTTKETTK